MKKILFFLLFLTTPLISEKQKTADPLEQYPEYFAEELKISEKVGDSRFFNEFIHMMIYLTGIVAFMILFMWILKRMLTTKIENSNRGSSIKILESRTLSQKTTLYVIEIAGKSYPIAESINGVTKLGEASLKKNKDPSSFDTLMTP